MSVNTDNFDRICGNCEGVGVEKVTEEDVRKLAAYWETRGEPCSEEEILSAIAGMREYQGK